MPKNPPKRGHKAPVWTYMEKLEAEGLILCLICKDKLKYTGGTSNMNKHLRTRHPLEFAEMIEETTQESVEKLPRTPATVQPTLMQTINKTQAYKDDSSKKQELDQLVVRMIVKDLQPLSVVENDGFRKLVHGLNPKYELPSRRVVARTLLPSLYNDEVQRVSDQLSEAKYVSLTTDLWTSRKTQGFITVTTHFISPEWELKSMVLETPRMSKSHTAENIAEEISRVCNKWNIKEKVCSVVTDNAANMSSAITHHLKLRHLPCFAHTLNLVVSDAIKHAASITTIVEKVKKIVTFFHHSAKASDKLSELQEKMVNL